MLGLSSATNGKLAMKAWEAEEEKTGMKLADIGLSRSGEVFRFDDVTAQPRQVIPTPVFTGSNQAGIDGILLFQRVSKGLFLSARSLGGSIFTWIMKCCGNSANACLFINLRWSRYCLKAGPMSLTNKSEYRTSLSYSSWKMEHPQYLSR